MNRLLRGLPLKEHELGTMGAFSKSRSFSKQFPSSPVRCLDTQVRVATPENIEFYYQLGGPFRRMLAYSTDVLITIVGFGLLCVLIRLIGFLLGTLFQGSFLGSLGTLFQQMLVGLLLAFGFLSLWFYGAFMETRFNGQTIGKMVTGLRTISVDGSAIDATQATLRNFFRLLDVSPFATFALFGSLNDQPVLVLPIFAFGLICMAANSRFQRIGDLVAGTIVVSEQKEWKYDIAQFQDPRVAQLAQMLPADFVFTADMTRTLAEFVDRRGRLSQARADEIAGHLSPLLIELFGLARDTNPELLLCALYYKQFGEHQTDKVSGMEYRETQPVTGKIR